MKTAVITTNTTGEVVTLEEIKQHLRLEVGETEEDEYLKALRAAAVDRAESITNRKLLTQSYYYYRNEWPCEDSFELPYAPLASVPSSGIVYKKSTGNSTTFSSTAWEYDSVSEPGRICLKTFGDSWPAYTLYAVNPIKVQMNVGYGDQSTEMPSGIRLAVKMLVAHWYENREATVAQSLSDVPHGVTALLQPYRIFKF